MSISCLKNILGYNVHCQGARFIGENMESCKEHGCLLSDKIELKFLWDVHLVYWGMLLFIGNGLVSVSGRSLVIVKHTANWQLISDVLLNMIATFIRHLPMLEALGLLYIDRFDWDISCKHIQFFWEKILKILQPYM